MFVFANDLPAFKLRFVSDLQRSFQVLTYVEVSFQKIHFINSTTVWPIKLLIVIQGQKRNAALEDASIHRIFSRSLPSVQFIVRSPVSVRLTHWKQFSAPPFFSKTYMEASNITGLIISQGRVSPLLSDWNPLLIRALALALKASCLRASRCDRGSLRVHISVQNLPLSGEDCLLFPTGWLLAL